MCVCVSPLFVALVTSNWQSCIRARCTNRDLFHCIVVHVCILLVYVVHRGQGEFPECWWGTVRWHHVTFLAVGL